MVLVSGMRNHRGMQYQWTMKRNNNSVADYDIAQYLIESTYDETDSVLLQISFTPIFTLDSRNKNYLNLNLEKFTNGDQIELNVHLQNFLGYQNDIIHRIQIVNVDIPLLEIRPSKDQNNFDVSEG